VVVIDFGLVTEPDPGSTVSGAGRTQRQAVGTLAYMAPEQRRGDPPGPAADQFAWAIAFAETLTGRAPPASAVAGRSSGAPPATGRPPRPLTRLLEIATRIDPEQRWSSMHEVTAELDAIERRGARRLVPVTVGLVGIAGTLAWWSAPSRDACDASQVVAWDELRRERLATELPSAGFVIAARIDERVGRLREQWSDACIADDETRATDLRMSCLELAREEIDVLLQAMDERPDHAPDLVAALPDLARCRDAERGEPPPTDPVIVARWLEIHRGLADVRAWQHGGRVGEGLVRADELLVEARAIAHGTTIVQVQLARGHALTEAGRYEEAALALREAAELGEAHHADDEVAAAYADLVWVVGYKQAQAEAGRELARSAAAWAPRTARPEHHAIQWRRAAGWLELEAGDPAAAMVHFDAALALAESWSDDGSRSDQLAMVLNGIGAAAMTMADLERAEEVFRRAASALATTRGRDQWQVAQVENNLAAVLRGRGRLAEAEAIFTHTLAVFERAFGPMHPLCGQTRLNMAVLGLDRGDTATAIAQAEAALEILVRTGGPEDAMVGKAHGLIGNARVQNGQPELAVISLERALDIERASLGGQHTSVGISETTLGSALYDAGRPADAIAHHRAAREIFERALGADHPHLAYALVNEALCHRALHDDVQAEPLLVRALEISDEVGRPDAATKLGALWLDRGEAARARDVLERAWTDDAKVERAPGLRGSTAFALARARAATGDEAGARRIAMVAAGLYAEAADDDGIARVQSWLDDLKPGSR
jgi:tetratricopeptide (TPR) repeat protein